MGRFFRSLLHFAPLMLPLLIVLGGAACATASETPPNRNAIPAARTVATATHEPQSVATAPAEPPASASLAPSTEGETLVIRVAEPQSDIPAYDRKDWRHWIDEDGDCQNARQEALIAESETDVIFADSDECRVIRVNLTGPYTGERFGDASDMDIDHMVPLANAHRSGGWNWSKERKAQFANDLSYPNHLIAVQSSANRSKGSKGPEDWKPPRSEYWCQYATDWVVIKQSWELTATRREANTLRDMLAGCAEPPSLVVMSAGDAPTPSATQPATPTVTPLSDNAPLYDPDGPDRDCSDFADWEDAQAFFIAAGGPEDDPHRLDGNDDGIACNSLRR